MKSKFDAKTILNLRPGEHFCIAQVIDLTQGPSDLQKSRSAISRATESRLSQLRAKGLLHPSVSFQNRSFTAFLHSSKAIVGTVLTNIEGSSDDIDVSSWEVSHCSLIGNLAADGILPVVRVIDPRIEAVDTREVQREIRTQFRDGGIPLTALLSGGELVVGLLYYR